MASNSGSEIQPRFESHELITARNGAEEQSASKLEPTNLATEASLSRPETRESSQRCEAPSRKPLELTPDHRYTVHGLDSLWTIAERRLCMDKADSTPYAVQAEVERLAKLNQTDHQSLEKNPHFLKNGWQLTIYDEKTQAKPLEKPAEKTQAQAATPEAPARPVDAPAKAASHGFPLADNLLANPNAKVGGLPIPFTFQNQEAHLATAPGFISPKLLGVRPYYFEGPGTEAKFGLKLKFDPPKPAVREEGAQDDEPLKSEQPPPTILPPPLNIIEKIFTRPRCETETSQHSPEYRLQPVTDKRILQYVPDARFIGEKGSIRTMIDGKPQVLHDQQYWLSKRAAESFIRLQDALAVRGRDLTLVDMNSAGRLPEQQIAIRVSHSAKVFARGHSRHQDGDAADISCKNYQAPDVLFEARQHGWLQGNANGKRIKNDPAHLSYVPQLDKFNPDNARRESRPELQTTHDNEGERPHYWHHRRHHW